MDFQIWVLIWISIVSTGFGANILIVCPYFTKSTYGFHVAIGRSLQAAGHQITIVHPFREDATNKNFIVIDCSLADQPNASNYLTIDEALQTTHTFNMLLWARDVSERDCDHTIQLEEIQKILRSKKKPFDIMIADLTDPLNECFLPIAEILNIPVIGTSTAKSWPKTDWLINNPNNPATIPTELSFWSSKMNFMQRLNNLWYWTIHFFFESFFVYPRLEVIYKKYFPNSSVSGRIKPSLIFANSHQLLIPRPSVPNVINIGGIHVETQPAKSLPQNLQKFIDGATDGVILFTFGSMIKMFEENSSQFDVFRTVFAQLPQRVIWKMENTVENLPKNVIISKWLPQRDILAHENVVAFITHCGMSGMFEAIYEAKPLIMIPIFYDQMSSSAILEDLNVGVSLNIKTLSVEKVLKALNNTIHDTKYQKQMQKISKIMKDAPITKEQAVVYWTEYVIRQKGAPYLRMSAADIPLYKYLFLDMILFVSVVFSVFVYFSLYCCKKLFTRIRESKRRTNYDSKKTK